MIIEIKSDVGKIEKGVANMSRLIIWVLRFEIHSDFLSASIVIISELPGCSERHAVCSRR